MRVISGLSRGTRLESIDSDSTRPTLDRIKENIFNIIQNDIRDTIVLDLFAGSGALGIEALSRGAEKAVFCDIDRKDILYLNKNLEKTRLKDKAQVFNKDYNVLLNSLNEKFDLIFLDPPYKTDYGCEAIKLILKNNLLNDNGQIILETDDEHRIANSLNDIHEIKIINQKKYGRVSIFIIKKL